MYSILVTSVIKCSHNVRWLIRETPKKKQKNLVFSTITIYIYDCIKENFEHISVTCFT